MMQMMLWVVHDGKAQSCATPTFMPTALSDMEYGSLTFSSFKAAKLANPLTLVHRPNSEPLFNCRSQVRTD